MNRRGIVGTYHLAVWLSGVFVCFADFGTVDVLKPYSEKIVVDQGDEFWLTRSTDELISSVTVDIGTESVDVSIKVGDKIPVKFDNPGEQQITVYTDGYPDRTLKVTIMPKLMQSATAGFKTAGKSGVSISMGSLYAGYYEDACDGTTGHKWPFRMVASQACTANLRILSGGSGDAWSGALNAGDNIIVVNNPSGVQWVLSPFVGGEQAGGTQTININTPYRLGVDNIKLTVNTLDKTAGTLMDGLETVAKHNAPVTWEVVPNTWWTYTNICADLFTWTGPGLAASGLTNGAAYTNAGSRQIQVSCNTDTTGASVTVLVQEVDQIQIDANSEWHDVTGSSIVVLKGTKYTFRAVPTPSTVAWASGSPIWSGVASGVGETIDVTFNSAGTKTLKTKAATGAPEKSVTIDVIVPSIDEVEFDNSYDIFDGTEMWRAARTGQSAGNDPGSFKRGLTTKVRVKFWHEKNLTYETDVKVLGDVSRGDEYITGGDYKETSMTFGTTWPNPGRLMESSVATVARVDYDHDVDIAWKYKVPSGTDAMIAAGKSENLVYYIVWDASQNGRPAPSAEAWADEHYTKAHLDDACNWGEGGATEDGLADKVCNSTHRLSVPNDQPYTVAGIWGIHDTGNGECDELALEMCYVMRCLGQEFFLTFSNLRPAIQFQGGINGLGFCTKHGKALLKVGVSWSDNNFQGAAYRTAAGADTICWDVQHNLHQKKYWELGNDKKNPVDAPGGRFGILYKYRWSDGTSGSLAQQIVNGGYHDKDPKTITFEFHGN